MNFTEIKLAPSPSGLLDLLISNDDLVTDDGLGTAVYISLFTDRRLPDTEKTAGDRRGFWADGLDPDDPEPWGSLLWTLENKRIDTTFFQRAPEICRAALAWMITDEIAQKIDVTVTRAALEKIRFEITIFRPNQNEPYRYYHLWDAQASGR